MIVIFYSSARQFDPMQIYYMSMANGHATDILESNFLHKFLSVLLESDNTIKLIPEITCVECVHQIGNDCTWCVLKN